MQDSYVCMQDNYVYMKFTKFLFFLFGESLFKIRKYTYLSQCLNHTCKMKHYHVDMRYDHVGMRLACIYVNIQVIMSAFK